MLLFIFAVITIGSIEAVRIVSGIIYYLSYHTDVWNSTSGSKTSTKVAKLEQLMLALLNKYAVNERWAPRLRYYRHQHNSFFSSSSSVGLAGSDYNSNMIGDGGLLGISDGSAAAGGGGVSGGVSGKDIAASRATNAAEVKAAGFALDICKNILAFARRLSENSVKGTLLLPVTSNILILLALLIVISFKISIFILMYI